jgi:tetratricopeptide (TPR) repeat protein
MKTTLALAILMLSASLAGAQDKMAEQLRKGIVEEEANQNLDKAIQTYQSILTQFDQGRPTAATALFHLAECYRKQGKKDEAIAAYRRVAQEFPDQNKLASASRDHLSKTYGISQNPREYPYLSTSGNARVVSTSSPTITEQRKSEEARLWYRALLLEEIALLEQQLESYNQRVYIGTLQRNGPEMTALKRDILELKRTLAAFDAGAMPIPPTSIKK